MSSSLSLRFFRKRPAQIIGIAALTIGLTGIGGAAFADATVSNENQLKSALEASGSETVILTADITVTADTIDVEGTKTLDLNGYKLDANSINLTDDSTLIIEDGSSDDSGELHVESANSGGIDTTGAELFINAGTINARSTDAGAAIGGGNQGDGGNITITGNANVTATAQLGGAAIGGGQGADGGNITIAGDATVTATGEWWGAGIGGGNQGDGGNITISGNATVTATAEMWGAGIGGGDQANGGNVTIAGNATVTATAGLWGAGIGGGFGGDVLGGGAGGNITITDRATVTATAEDNGAGIGGGDQGDSGDIAITGEAYVTATAKGWGSAVGGGNQGDAESIKIMDGATVVAKSEKGSAVGAGVDGGRLDDLLIGGHLTINSYLHITAGDSAIVESTGTITGSGGLTGEGTIGNHGIITQAEVDVDDDLTITDHNYLVSFKTDDSANDPDPVRVYASTFDDGERVVPNLPTGALAWVTALDASGEEFDDAFDISADMTVYAVTGPSEIVIDPETATVDEGDSLDFIVTGKVPGFPDIDATSDVTLTSSVATDIISGNTVTFTTASTHVITATHKDDPALTTAATITVTPADTGNNGNDDKNGGGDSDDNGDGDDVNGESDADKNHNGRDHAEETPKKDDDESPAPAAKRQPSSVG